MPLFSKRHYEWLARFAAINLDDSAAIKLRHALKLENSKFDHLKFNRAVSSIRNDARDAALERASLPPIGPLARARR